MDEGTIVVWLKQPGEQFRRGDILLELESDKINVEVPALEDGAMIRHLASPGDKVTVGHPIAVIRAGPGSRASEREGKGAIEQSKPLQQPESFQNRSGALATTKVRASPAARHTAKTLGVKLGEVKGSGPRGRIKASDVREFARTGEIASGKARVSGLAVPALRWGSPQQGTCVLFHGFAGDPSTWRRTGEFLGEQGFEAIAFELPGHGSQPLVASSVREMAADLSASLPSRQNTKLHLIGHSLGGALAILIAASNPDRVASLTLLAPIGIGTYIDQSFLDGIVSVGTIEALERELRKTTARPLSYAKSALVPILETRPTDRLLAISRMIAQDGVQQLFLVPELEKIAVPVRVFFGRQDRILHWQDALSLPGKVALHLFDAGHMPHWEDPSAVLPLLAEFPGRK